MGSAFQSRETDAALADVREQGCGDRAKEVLGGTSRFARRIADHTRSKCRAAEAKAAAEASAASTGRAKKVRAGGTRHLEALDGVSLKGQRLKEMRLDRGVEGGVWRVVPDPVIGKKQKKLSLGSVDDVRQMRKALLSITTWFP